MLGYRCDRCARFEPGRDSQREGMHPPENWTTVTGLGPVTHLCAECSTEARAALLGEAVPALDRRPHSRACGPAPHPHGSQCHTNCPTCHGEDQ